MSLEGGKFLDTKYKDLTGSPEVDRAVEKAKRDPERKFAPHTRDERIEAYLDRLDYVIKDERGWRRLKQKLVNEFAVDVNDEDTVEKIAQSLYESEKRLAIEQGRGGDIAKLDTEDVIEKYKGAIHEKHGIQERTLTTWLNYLAQNDAQYPTWFRYFVVRNLEKMGTLNKEKGEYSKRNEYTIAPFPELNSEALGFVYRLLTTGLGHQEFTDTPEKREQLLTLIEKKDFIKLYTFAQIETAGALNREHIDGEWVKYDQHSDHHILENALKGKGTGWCTAEGSAYAHLTHGDFHVYFSRGPKGTYSEPRIAIRMENDQIAEVRGVNHRQELEPQLVDIATERYHTLPGGEKYDKKSADMKHMTLLTQKHEKNEPFTKDDLRFLYELDTTIEGFGYERDPRILELLNHRQRKEDIATMADCAPEDVTIGLANTNNLKRLTPTTVVYAEDDGTKLNFVDFRTPENQPKLPILLELRDTLTEVGSPAVPDLLFEGGLVSVDVPPSITDWTSAAEAFKAVDGGTKSYIWDEWGKGEWTPSTETHLDIIVLSYNADPTTRRSSDKIVADMDRLGLRPLTLEEMTTAGIQEPKFTKTPEKYFVGLTKYERGGDSCVPGLWQNDVARRLDRSGWVNGWDDGYRFLCVRK